jgi:hypothetical protein
VKVKTRDHVTTSASDNKIVNAKTHRARLGVSMASRPHVEESQVPSDVCINSRKCASLLVLQKNFVVCCSFLPSSIGIGSARYFSGIARSAGMQKRPGRDGGTILIHCGYLSYKRC